MTGYIVSGFLVVFFGFLAVGAMNLNAEKERHEREKNKIRQEGAENAKHTADIITEAEKIKNNANTGNHSNDLHTMADQLHHYANSRQ